jgi:hypothetical protein
MAGATLAIPARSISYSPSARKNSTQAHGDNSLIATIGVVMKRMDLYIKVEVELDEDEKPDKVANEICRVVQKLYVVRKAELSSAVAKE